MIALFNCIIFVAQLPLVQTVARCKGKNIHTFFISTFQAIHYEKMFSFSLFLKVGTFPYKVPFVSSLQLPQVLSTDCNREPLHFACTATNIARATRLSPTDIAFASPLHYLHVCVYRKSIRPVVAEISAWEGIGVQHVVLRFSLVKPMDNWSFFCSSCHALIVHHSALIS